jgi:putative methyltransferase (TIGR04325 family)
MPDLRRWLPPILLDLGRRLRPPRPRFRGVFPSAAEAPDESPFASEAWRAFSEARLAGLCGPQPKAFLPAHPLPMAQFPVALLANLLAEVSVCRVLDFGGGSGAIYFLLHPYLAQPGRVEWDVFDDESLMAIGRSRRRDDHRLRFLKALPEPGRRYELLHVNTTLQYIHEPLACLERLLQHRPRYVVLSRLLAGEVPTWYTAEMLRARRAPCAILDVRELTAWLDARGYRLVFKAPALDEPIPDTRYAPDIPAALRIPHALHLVFAESRPPDRLSP